MVAAIFVEASDCLAKKSIVNQCSSVDTVGDNKLSMKCFEINIFFFWEEGVGSLFPFDTLEIDCSYFSFYLHE